jgi:protein gp37
MSERTGIAWCDHTFNPWIGCQKVSEGCRHCYAERENGRFGWVDRWGVNYRRTSESNWKKPVTWAKNAVREHVIRRVFSASLADVFDLNVPDEWRNDLFRLILETDEIGGLEWLILTKRPENITQIPARLDNMASVRIGITAENQDMANKRVPQFLRDWRGKNFLSIEPMLSPVTIPPKGWQFIDWAICGCESGPNARPTSVEWVRGLRDECVGAGVPFFLKQMAVDKKLVTTPMLDGRQWMEFPIGGDE